MWEFERKQLIWKGNYTTGLCDPEADHTLEHTSPQEATEGAAGLVAKTKQGKMIRSPNKNKLIESPAPSQRSRNPKLKGLLSMYLMKIRHNNAWSEERECVSSTTSTTTKDHRDRLQAGVIRMCFAISPGCSYSQ